MAKKPTRSRSRPAPSAPSGSNVGRYAVVLERTVRLQHVLNMQALNLDMAIELAEQALSKMSDDDFDWREEAHDVWSAFGRRDNGPEAGDR